MRKWLVFVSLALFCWGPSFMWIKVALHEIGPFSLTMYRMGFGTITAWALMKALHLPFRFTRQRFLGSMFVGAIGFAIPMSLLSWGETRINSGLAGIINGTVPLWTFVIAHFWLHDEKVNRTKSLGLALGFLGLVMLVSRDLHWQGFREGSIWGQLAVIGMAVGYAISIVYTRRYLKGQHPVQTAAVSIATAFAITIIFTLVFESRIPLPERPLTWLATAWMGVIGLGLAMWGWFHLIETWGATRASLVTYLVPVVAVVLGVLLLGETITWRLIVGGTLVIGGIAIMNVKWHRARNSPRSGELSPVSS